jgi:hypothetical protein
MPPSAKVSPAARAIAVWMISGLTRRQDNARRLAEYRFSRHAVTDLEAIAEYTVESCRRQAASTRCNSDFMKERLKNPVRHWCDLPID